MGLHQACTRRQHPHADGGLRIVTSSVQTQGEVLRGFRIATALVVAACIAVAAQTAAHASVTGLMVSTDGVNYAPGRPLPMFEVTERLVPGDHLRDSVWVRNDASFATRLRIDVTQPDSDSPELAAGLTLAVSQQGTALGKPLSFDHSIANGSCTVLANGIMLKPGEGKRLDFELTMAPRLKEREATGASGHFSVRGVLEEQSVPEESAPGGACSDEHGGPENPTHQPPGPLVLTGAQSLLMVAMLGGIAACGGGLFAWRSWKQKSRSTEGIR